jgi:hypothetical protein
LQNEDDFGANRSDGSPGRTIFVAEQPNDKIVYDAHRWGNFDIYVYVVP